MMKKVKLLKYQHRLVFLLSTYFRLCRSEMMPTKWRNTCSEFTMPTMTAMLILLNSWQGRIQFWDKNAAFFQMIYYIMSDGSPEEVLAKIFRVFDVNRCLKFKPNFNLNYQHHKMPCTSYHLEKSTQLMPARLQPLKTKNCVFDMYQSFSPSDNFENNSHQTFVGNCQKFPPESLLRSFSLS